MRTTDRREFLLGALAAGVGLGLGGLGVGCASGRQTGGAAQTRAPRNRPLGVALLGLGEYSESQLAPALMQTRHCKLRGIVTGSPHKVPKWRERYGIPEQNVYDYGSLPSIAGNPEIDVVYMVTPTALHAKYAILAAKAGKHVWCEKPMAMNVGECQAIIDACRANQVTLSIGYRMQHEPNTQTVTQFARDKPYGAIRRVRAIAGAPDGRRPSWRMDPAMGGGALYDMGVYSINALRYSTGEEPLRVTKARQWADRPELYTAVDENTEFELEFPSGAVGYGKASRFDGTNVLRVEADRGRYQLEPMQAYAGVKGVTSDGRALDRTVDDQQAKQMDDDALAILEGKPLLVPGEEGLRDIRIVTAIMQAAKTGQPAAVGG